MGLPADDDQVSAAPLIKGRYEVLETLGSGGEARVVKALDRQLERIVALKIRELRDDNSREELLNEARILLAVPPHPALPLVREDFFDGNRYVVAMDWVDGTDLATLLRERGRPGLAPSSVLSYLAQAAEALTHLHSQNPSVIHGDVKPANLILSTGGRVKLVDFGLSSAPDAPRRRVGTPGYRAPELAADGRPSRSSDVFALAATAFALLTGAPPAGRLPSWEGIDPAQAKQLEAALRLGLATDPGRRPATPGELVERLRTGWGAALPTGVMTFCLSDIEGSTALWETDPAAMAEALVRHDEVIAMVMEARGGRFLKSMGEGDSTVSVFESAPQAVAAAVDATRALQEEVWPRGLRIAVRFGVHTGEADRRGADYFGPTLSLAARLRGEADGGQVFVSATTAGLAGAHLPAGCELIDLGPHRLKGLRAPQRIHAVRGPGLAAPLAGAECPYRGLLPFEPDDRRFFFGREEVVKEVLRRLRPGRLLAVVGASGSGKSSLLRAGVVAAVKAGEVGGLHSAQVFAPGPDAELDVADDPAELVVVDQFEELYTVCRDPERRSAFIERLLALTSPVVIGMRADFYGMVSGHPALARAVAGDQVLLGAMTRPELERAITEPARLAGLRLQPGLVDLVLRDVGDEPGALPLLSHALRVTWERRDGRTLTIEGYRDSGGVASAIARTADAVVESLPAEQHRLMRGLLLRLTEIGEGIEDTRRRVPVQELVPDGVSPEGVEAVLERLAEARLVMLGEGTAEVAHEALIREWPTLRGWLEEDRAGIRLHRQLSTAARLWDMGGREPADLYRGTRLGAAVDWAQTHPEALNASERAFLDASVAAAESERQAQIRVNRRLRELLAGAGALAVLAAVAGGVALNQRGEARAQAVAADAERLGSLALVEPRLDRAVLLARAGVHLDDSLATRGNLLATLNRSPAAVGVVRTADTRVLALDLSPDGRTLVVGDNRGNLVFVDARTRRRVGRLRLPATVFRVAYSPDGTRVAVGGARNDGPARGHGVLVDPATRRVVAELPGMTEQALDGLAFSPDGRTLMAGFNAGPSPEPLPSHIARYDGRTGEPLGRPVTLRTGTSAMALAFTSDGRRVVAGGGKRVVLLDARSLRTLRTFAVPSFSTALSPDDRTVAAAAEEGTVRLLDLRTGRVRIASGRHQTDAQAVRFSPDGRTFVTAGDDGTAIVWDAGTAAPRETLEGHGGRVLALGISDDGATLYTGSLDGSVIAWDLAGDRRLARPFTVGTGDEFRNLYALSPDGRTAAVRQARGFVNLVDTTTLRRRARIRVSEPGQAPGLAFAPDGRRLALGQLDGALELWDAQRGVRLRRTPAAHEGFIYTPAFSDDGRILASTSDASVVRLWNARTGEPTGRPLRFRRQFVGDIDLSPDGRLLAVGLQQGPESGSVEILDVRTRRRVARLGGHRAGVLFSRFSPDGRLVASADLGGTARIWSAATWKAIGRPLTGHAGFVNFVSFNRDRRTVATSSTDGTVRLWDIGTQRQIGSPLPGVPNDSVVAQFLPSGDRLLAVHAGGLGFSWDVRPEAWARHACAVAGRPLTRAEWADVLPQRPYQPVCAGS